MEVAVEEVAVAEVEEEAVAVARAVAVALRGPLVPSTSD
jgi:hypothetical protein